MPDGIAPPVVIPLTGATWRAVSDDRSAQALQTKVQAAAEMRSVMGSRKPNCIILDEVDGLYGGGTGQVGPVGTHVCDAFRAFPNHAHELIGQGRRARHRSRG